MCIVFVKTCNCVKKTAIFIYFSKTIMFQLLDLADVLLLRFQVYVLVKSRVAYPQGSALVEIIVNCGG